MLILHVNFVGNGWNCLGEVILLSTQKIPSGAKNVKNYLMASYAAFIWGYIVCDN